MKFRKIFAVLSIAILGFMLVACTTDEVTVTFNVNGGTMPSGVSTTLKVAKDGKIGKLPEPTMDDMDFNGWYTEKTGGTKYSSSTKVSGDITLYAQWVPAGSGGTLTFKKAPNYYGFNGDGMLVNIAVLPVNEFNPFDGTYTGNDKLYKQKHQNNLEQAYNIDLEWVAWPDDAPWGPERVKWISNSYVDKTLADKNIYIVNIASQWIPTLVKSNVLAKLSTVNNQTLAFSEIGYEQENTANEATAVNGFVYGFANGAVRPDYFMYYNIDLVKQANMEDPAELWFRGEWTLEKFELWVQQAQTNLNAISSTKKVLGVGFAEFVIGLVGSTGGQLVTPKPASVNFLRSEVTNVFDKIQTLYASGAYVSRGVEDVATSFNTGDTILVHGDLWFLKNSTRFLSVADGGVRVGVVPYPAKTNYGTPKTTSNSEEALFEYNGEYVSGLTFSAGDFEYRVPYTGTSCFGVIATENGKNGINSNILTNIIYDLYENMAPNPEDEVVLTPNQAYRNYLEGKLDRSIDIEVIMSLQGRTYFELLEMVSMTVGEGSHFTGNAFWPLAASICKDKTITPSTRLNEVLDEYMSALRQLGY